MKLIKLIIELKERGRVIGLKRLIGRLIEWFCIVLSDEIVHSCYRSVFSNVDSRRVKEGISIKVSFSSFGLILEPSIVALLVIP
jgi:hypothetical protein